MVYPINHLNDRIPHVCRLIGSWWHLPRIWQEILFGDGHGVSSPQCPQTPTGHMAWHRDRKGPTKQLVFSCHTGLDSKLILQYEKLGLPIYFTQRLLRCQETWGRSGRWGSWPLVETAVAFTPFTVTPLGGTWVYRPIVLSCPCHLTRLIFQR